MIPYTDDALRMLSQRLMQQTVPELPSAYSQSDALLIGMLMNAIADEVAHGIDRRCKDIEQLKLLLTKGAIYYEAGEIVDRELLNLSLSEVNLLRDQLIRALEALHTCVEQSDLPGADVLSVEIWQYYEDMVARHRITAAG